MALSLSATIAYSFVASAIVGLSFNSLTDRVSVKWGFSQRFLLQLVK
jgi:hypothetical protein